MIKIGIDLSLNSCGIVAYNDEKKIIKYASTHHFLKRKLNLETDIEVHTLIGLILEKVGRNFNGEIALYIEIGNYGNARMTQKFGILAGMLIAEFTSQVANNKKWFVRETKLITPNEWFARLFQDNKITDKHYNALTRDERKKISMKLSGLNQNDISDAYWIAIYGHKCKGAYDE